MGCWLVAVGDTESVLRLAFGSCNVPRECQQLGELPVGAVEAAAVFLELTYIPEFWLIREDLLGLLGLRRGPISRGLAVWAWRARVQSPQTHVKSQRWWPTLIIPMLPEASWLVSLPRLIWGAHASERLMLEKQDGSSDMALWVKTLCAKPDNLGLRPRIQ